MSKRDLLQKKNRKRETTAPATANFVTEIADNLEMQDSEQETESVQEKESVTDEMEVTEKKSETALAQEEPETESSPEPAVEPVLADEKSMEAVFVPSEDKVTADEQKKEEEKKEEPEKQERKPASSSLPVSGQKLSDYKKEESMNEVKYFRTKKEAPKRYVVHVTKSFKDEFENKVREYERSHAPKKAKKVSLNKFIVAIFQQYISNDFQNIQIYSEASTINTDDLWSMIDSERKDKVIGCSFPVEMAEKIESKAMEIQMPVSQLIISGLYTFTITQP